MQQAYNPQTGEVLFLVNNQWVKPQQEAVNPKTKERAFLVGNEWQVVPSSAFGTVAEQAEEKEVPSGLSASLVPEQFKAGVSSLQQSYFANTARNNAALLNMFDRIDRGEEVRPVDDVVGYADMNPEQRKQVREQVQSALTSSTARVIAYGAEKEGFARNPKADEFVSLADAGNYAQAWETFKSDPLGIVQQLSVESLPNTLPSLVTGGVAALLRGGLAAFMAGMAGGSLPIEFNASIIESLQDAKVDLKDAAAVEAKLRDPEFIKAAGDRAITRGTVIAGADALSGAVLRPFRAGQLGRNVARGGANVGAEVGLEMAGEAGAQAASGEEFKVGQILAEGLGAGPSAVGVTGVRTLLQARADREQLQREANLEQIQQTVNTPQSTPGATIDEQAAALIEHYAVQFPRPIAESLAAKVLQAREEAEAQAGSLGVSLPPDLKADPLRVEALEQEWISAGVDPQIARAEAVEQATEEAYNDWVAEQEEAYAASQQGAANVGEPVTPAGGEGVRVAGEPPAGAPAGGAGVSEAAGVVSPATDAGVPAGGETTAPGAVTTRPARVSETGAFIPSSEKGGDPLASASFRTLDEDDDIALGSDESLNGATFISGIDVRERNKGLGSKLLKAILDWADTNNKTLVLVPSAQFDSALGGLNQEQLREWYTRNGFEDRVDYMVRKPLTTGAPSGTEASQTVETKKEGPAASAEAAATKPDAAAKPAKPEKPLGPIQQAKKLAQDAYNSSTEPEAREQAIQQARATVEGQGNKAALSYFDREINNLRLPEERITPAPKKRGRPKKEAVEGAAPAPAKPRGRKPLTEEQKTAQEAANKAKRAQRNREETALKIADGQLAFAADETKDEIDRRGSRKSALHILYEISKTSAYNPQRVKAREALKAANVTPAEMAAIEKTHADWRKSQQEDREMFQLAQATSENVEAPDTAFARFTNGAQTALHIARTATNGFHKFLAKRLSQLRVLRDVKFVVIEEGQALPAELQKSKLWAASRGLYKVGSNTIYVRGSSFGNAQGINNITILHELLHAALHKKVRAGLQLLGLSKVFKPLADRQLAKLVSDLTSLANRAKSYYEANMTELDDRITSLIEGTIRRNKDGTFSFDIFTPDEFISYGMTEPDFQEFLKQVPGEQKRFTGFSQFVRSILDYFGMLPATKAEARVKADYSAMANLIDITDKLIGVRSIPKVQNILIKALGLDEPAPKALPQQIRQRASRVDKTLQKTLNSHSSTPTFMDGLRKLVVDRQGGQEILADILSSRLTSFRDGTLRQILPTLQTGVIVEWAKRLGMTNIVRAQNIMRDMSALRNKLTLSAVPISEDLNKLQRKNSRMYEQLATVMHYATLRGKDPATQAGYDSSPALAKLWDKLDDNAKGLYKRVRDYYQSNYELYYQTLTEQIQNSGVPGEASDPSTPKGKLMASIKRMYETGKQTEPYFPLMRYGQFWVRIGKGKQGKFYMFESQAEKEMFIKTWFRAEKKKDPSLDLDALRQSNDVEDGNTITDARKSLETYTDLLKNIFDVIESAKAKPVQVIDDFGNQKTSFTAIDTEKLKDEIYQLALHTLPNTNFRRKFIHRQGKEGFSKDIARNFATLSTDMAHQLARLKYSPEVMKAVDAAKDALEGNPDKAKLGELVTEMRIRAEMQAYPTQENSLGHRMANFANTAAFLYMMSNVKTAVAQMSAIPVFVAPVLWSKHGLARTAKALGSFAAIWNSVGVRERNPDGTTSWVAPTIAQSKRVRLNPEERRAAQFMIDRGISETTLAYDLGNRRKTPTEVQNSIPRRVARTVTDAMTALFHHSERLIREVAFMASFRLYRQKFPNKSFEEIAELAENDTYAALGNFAAEERPRGIGATAEREVMLDAHKPLGRAVLQFKMFPAFVTTYFVRNFYRMLKGQSKEERREAFRQFFGTLTMSATLAGVMGIPGLSFLLGVLSALRKLSLGEDDEDPLEKRDLEFWFRNVWLPETFGDIKIGGKPLSDLLDRGVIAALTGFDITSSISLNNMWFPEMKETASAQASMQDYFISILGPFASLTLKQLPKAIDFFNQGKILQGMEQLMPAMVRSPITAYRYATEGASTTWGAEIKPDYEFTIGQIIGQSLGFSSEGLVAQREALFKANALRLQVQQDKRKLLDRLDLEFRGERGDVNDAVDKIINFNRKNWFDPIQVDQLSKSLINRIERRESAERGFPVDEKYYPQLERLLRPGVRKLEAEAAK